MPGGEAYATATGWSSAGARGDGSRIRGQSHEALRAGHGWHRPILCLGAPVVLSTCEQADAFACEDCCQAAVAADIDATISSVAEARLLAAAAGRQHRRARVQIKIDTGMGRMGIRWEDALPVLAEICACAGVSVEGVYTHGTAAK